MLSLKQVDPELVTTDDHRYVATHYNTVHKGQIFQILKLEIAKLKEIYHV
jgi:hypothetical protein